MSSARVNRFSYDTPAEVLARLDRERRERLASSLRSLSDRAGALCAANEAFPLIARSAAELRTRIDALVANPASETSPLQLQVDRLAQQVGVLEQELAARERHRGRATAAELSAARTGLGVKARARRPITLAVEAPVTEAPTDDTTPHAASPTPNLELAGGAPPSPDTPVADADRRVEQVLQILGRSTTPIAPPDIDQLLTDVSGSDVNAADFEACKFRARDLVEASRREAERRAEGRRRAGELLRSIGDLTSGPLTELTDVLTAVEAGDRDLPPDAGNAVAEAVNGAIAARIRATLEADGYKFGDGRTGYRDLGDGRAVRLTVSDGGRMISAPVADREQSADESLAVDAEHCRIASNTERVLAAAGITVVTERDLRPGTNSIDVDRNHPYIRHTEAAETTARRGRDQQRRAKPKAQKRTRS